MKSFIVAGFAGLLMVSGLVACAAPTNAESANAAVETTEAVAIVGKWSEGTSFEGSKISFDEDGNYSKTETFTALGIVAGPHSLPHFTVREHGTWVLDGDVLTTTVTETNGHRDQVGTVTEFRVTFKQGDFGQEEMSLSKINDDGTEAFAVDYERDGGVPLLGMPKLNPEGRLPVNLGGEQPEGRLPVNFGGDAGAPLLGMPILPEGRLPVNFGGDAGAPLLGMPILPEGRLPVNFGGEGEGSK
jgi:hypothetical protein